MWRSRVLSTEAIQVVHSLKLAKASPAKLDEVFCGRLSRLLKADLVDTLEELQRQNELDLALKDLGLRVCEEGGMVQTRFIPVLSHDSVAGEEQND